MPECIFVQLEAPSGSSEGAVIEGFYILNGEKLTMTFANGEPVQLDGKNVERVLTAGENPRVIAARLTREIRRALNPERVAGFGRSMHYNSGLA